MTSKRIFVVTTAQDQPMSMLAGYRDGQLHIIECERLPRNLAKLKEKLPEKLTDLRQKGFIVLVDEVLPVFGQYGRSVRLADPGHDGRPILVSALESYRNMHTLQAISFPSGLAGHFEISESVVEQQRDANGRVTYNIDWSELKAETTVLLLAINAATQDSLNDTPTATALLKALGATDAKPNIMNPFNAITKSYDKQFLSTDVFDGGKA